MIAPAELRASIILVGYNSAAVLGPCLSSLLAQDLNPSHFEVVFIDNASTDGTVDLVSGYRDRIPHLRVLRNERNVGFPAAVNRAAAEARSPILVLLNPDTVAEPAWLRELIRAIEADPAVALAGSRVVNGDGPGLYAAALEILYGGVCVVHEGNRRTDAVSGCALAVRADVFRELGGLAGDLFMYAEDLDFGLRVRAAGRRIAYAPASVVHHAAHRASRASTRTYMFYMARNRTLVCMRNYRRKRLYLLLDALVLFPLVSARELLRSRAKGRALRWLFEARVESLKESMRLLRTA